MGTTVPTGPHRSAPTARIAQRRQCGCRCGYHVGANVGRHLGLPCGSMRKDAMPETLSYIDVGAGAQARAIAVRAQDGAPPGLFWLGGFKSDMKGTKAEALDAFAAAQRGAYARLGYSRHGEAGGGLLR